VGGLRGLSPKRKGNKEGAYAQKRGREGGRLGNTGPHMYRGWESNEKTPGAVIGEGKIKSP